MCAAVAATSHGHTEAPRKASPHSEPGGQTSLAPPTKAEGHPFQGLYPLGGFGTPTFRSFFFFCGDAPATLRNVPQDPSQSLAPFWVRRMNFAGAPQQGYRPPVSGPLGPFWHPDLGEFFLGVAVPSTSRGHTKAPHKDSPHSESGSRTSPAPPTKANGYPFLGLFPLGGFGTPTFGPLFLGADALATLRNGGFRHPDLRVIIFFARMLPPLLEMCPEVPRKASPHSWSGGRTSPAPPTKAIAHPSQGHWSHFGTPT